MTVSLVSVIVPAHNEAPLLGATLDAIAVAVAALALDAEIVVVDDASSDGTAQVALARGVRVVRVEHRHIAATRNAGARAAAGSRLLFVDADTLVDAEVVAAAMAALDAGASGGGAAVLLADGAPVHARRAARLFAWIFRATRIAPGCFLFCTRDAFEAAGGFDEGFYAGEDVAMSRALARQGRFVILREGVRTSARKLQTFSALEHLQLALRFAVRGRRMLRSRQDLDLWYGERRHAARRADTPRS
jgi:glycosyltransferase involved in cell wall biosynthesis